MKFDLSQIEIRDGGIWISKFELSKKFKSMRNKGYANYKLWREGCKPCLCESIRCHAKADVLWDLISYIESEET